MTPTSTAPAASAAPAPLDAGRWQSRLDELTAAHRVAGASLAVLRVGEDGHDELVEAASGTLNVDTGVEATTGSVFQLGSTSKVWTATLVMQLVEEGRLDLDAPLRAVLPDLKLSDAGVAETVTMRHLLTHTSGIDGDAFHDTGRGDDCVEKYVAALATTPQLHPLGATFSYCNSGFVLAGRVVEVLTGSTWDRALRERIVAPLGLERTTTLPEESMRFRVAVGHDAEPGQDPTLVPVFGMPRSLGPAGLITATAADAAAFAAMHLRGGVGPDGTRVLGEAGVAAMQEHQTDLPDRWSLGDSWGLGWIRYGWDGHRAIGHDGGTLGQRAFLRALPEQGLVVSLLTNSANGRDLADDLLAEVFAEVAGVAVRPGVQPPRTPYEVDAATLAGYTGSYRRTSVTTEVAERDGSLVLRMVPDADIAELVGEDVEELTLVPVEEGVFAARPQGATAWTAVTFYSLDDGSEYLHTGARTNLRTA